MPLRPNLAKASDGAANKVGDFLSSKTAIILFAVLPLLSLGESLNALLHGDVQSFIAWLSQSFIQLVALPVLAYIARMEGVKTEARDNETHDAVMAAHDETRQILAALHDTVAQKLEAS